MESKILDKFQKINLNDSNLELFSCPVCGSLVNNPETHYKWHQRLTMRVKRAEPIVWPPKD